MNACDASGDEKAHCIAFTIATNFLTLSSLLNILYLFSSLAEVCC